MHSSATSINSRNASEYDVIGDSSIIFVSYYYNMLGRAVMKSDQGQRSNLEKPLGHNPPLMPIRQPRPFLLCHIPMHLGDF